MTHAEQVVLRRAARVVLVDEQDHVLMIHGFDPRTPHASYWYTLGGGIADGEEPRAAAVREVLEETEVRSTVAIGWVPARALDQVAETVFPANLPELVDALVASEAATRAPTSQNWL